MPIWITNISIVSSIFGLAFTVYVLLEVQKIRNSYLRRARLPETIKEITEAHKTLFRCLKNWQIKERSGIEQFSITRSLLVNLSPKLPDTEKNEISKFVKTLQRREYIFIKTTISEATVDEAWEIYTNLTGIITTLNQLHKDSKWD